MQNNFNDINENDVPFISFDKAWSGLKLELDAEAKRREKRKRRFIFFWLSLAIIGFGGSVMFMVSRSSSIENGIVKKNDDKKIVNNEQGMMNSEVEKKVKNIEQGISNFEVKKQQSKIKNEVEVLNEIQKIKGKQQFILSKANAFQSIKSFTNLSEYKKENEIVSTNKNSSQAFIISQKNDVSFASNPITTIDSAILKNDSAIIIVKEKTKEDKATAKNSKPKALTSNKLNYGLQWNIPVLSGANFFDINTNKQPATLLIPSFWISKQFGKKHSVQLQFNPYSQYYFNNKAVVDFDKYNVTIHQGSQATNKPENIVYTEATSFNKLISIEASVAYHYQLSSKLKIGVELSNSWIKGALMDNKVVRNYAQVTRDSLYGIDKANKEWSYLNSSFILGKFEVLYEIKKFDVGINFSKPISHIFTGSNQYKTPINTNLFLRWKIK